MGKLRRWVEERKMNQVYAHTSGHAYPSTLRRLVDAMKPKQIIPIHTVCPEAYAELFTPEVRVVRDGERVAIPETKEEP